MKDIDPGIERTVLACLSPRPADRPASALVVATSLPGGDPLAAALAYSQVVFSGALSFWLLNTLASVVRGTGNMLLPALAGEV